jgi:hypothetical protein
MRSIKIKRAFCEAIRSLSDDDFEKFAALYLDNKNLSILMMMK